MDVIPPGQEGRIQVKVSTGGYGGKRIAEAVRIKTNDPDQPVLVATVKGFVEKFAEITPERVRLMGPAGKPLSARIEIVPRKEYPFTIRDVKAKHGKFIKLALIETCNREQNRCVIRVENTKTDKGRFLDVIYVKTDSPVRQEIPIYVTGLIR